MGETASTFGSQDQKIHNGGNGAPAPGRRLLKRPTTAEMERIARECPSEKRLVSSVIPLRRRRSVASEQDSSDTTDIQVRTRPRGGFSDGASFATWPRIPPITSPPRTAQPNTFRVSGLQTQRSPRTWGRDHLPAQATVSGGEGTAGSPSTRPRWIGHARSHAQLGATGCSSVRLSAPRKRKPPRKR